MFLRFLVVGGVGFLIDASTTYLLIRLGTPPSIARLPAIAVAMTFTWAANRYFTFEVKAVRSGEEVVRYASTAAAMSLLNYLIYFVLQRAGLWPVAAVFIATAFQALVSYYCYKNLVFRRTA